MRIRLWITLLLVTAGSACSAQSLPSSVPSPGSPMAPFVSSEPFPTSSLDPGGPRGPSDWTAFLDDKVAAGEWTIDTGVVHLLRALNGIAPLPVGDDLTPPVRGSATGVAQRARDVIAAGSEQGPEIQALLDQLLPDRATLEQISVPSATSRGIAIRGDTERPLVAQSLPPECSPDDPLPGLDGGICLEYAERRAGPVSVRLYYPRAWHGDTERAPFFELALEGVAHAIEVYTGLELEAGPTVDIVFSNLPSLIRATWMADAMDVGSGCQIRVFPIAWENWRGAVDRADRVRQVLAHELFHCFQAWNFNGPWRASSAQSRWWAEGTAEFFSNVAYPAANAEYDFRGGAARFPDPGIFGRDYGNVFFFQHMANTAGISAVTALLATLPPTGDLEPQVEALRSFPGIDAIFQGYGEALLDQRIDDQGQGPFDMEPVIPGDSVTGLGNVVDIEVEPFVVHRVKTAFAEGNLYTITTQANGTPQAAARPDETTSWNLPPDLVASGCTELQYVWALTAVDPDETFLADVTDLVESECDPCLIGTWDLDNSTYEAFIPGNPELTYEGTSGRMYMSYAENGRFTSGFANFTTSTSQETEDFLTGDPVTQIVELVMNGRAAGLFTVGGGRLTIQRSDYDFEAVVRIIYGGDVLSHQPIPFPGGSLPLVFNEPMPYVCTDQELRFTVVVNERDFSPLRFVRSALPVPTEIPGPSASP